MVARLAQWDRGAGFAAIRADWLARAAGIGKPIRVKTGDGELAGTFEAIDDAGRLVLRLADGTMQAVAAGDVFIRLGEVGRRMAGPQGELVFAPLGGVGEIGMNLVDLRARRRAPPHLARRRCRRVVRAGGEPAGHRSGPAGHPLSDRGAPQHRRHRPHPRPRGPFRRAARPLAEAEGAGLCDAVHRGAARGQARRASRRAGDPGHGGGARLALQRRAVRHRACARSRIRSRNRTR